MAGRRAQRLLADAPDAVAESEGELRLSEAGQGGGQRGGGLPLCQPLCQEARVAAGRLAHSRVQSPAPGVKGAAQRRAFREP
ncbi:hypothetical protein [Streptomyces sp. NPDC094031]|uniref:hypothetical protein n=1 Tax=Streptomyces sp. NPDC094031 TaxID=3155307 RepID=UPI00331F1BE9